MVRRVSPMQQRLGPSGPGTMIPEAGTTEHALMILVLLEIAALVLLRRYFVKAHGG